MTSLRRYLLGLDIYERHAVVSDILCRSDSRTVIDIGGTAGMLQMFSDRYMVTAVNVDDSGDVKYEGKRLPYADRAFDAAVSMDILEHTPPRSRNPFVEELVGVAKGHVVSCGPLGSDFHRQAEIELNEIWRQTFGEYHRFLSEHIENGLPTLPEIEGEAILACEDHELLFASDVRLAGRLFLNQLRMLTHSNLLVRWLSLLVHALSVPRHRLKVAREPSEFTNRVYAHVVKND